MVLFGGLVRRWLLEAGKEVEYLAFCNFVQGFPVGVFEFGWSGVDWDGETEVVGEVVGEERFVGRAPAGGTDDGVDGFKFVFL